MKTHLICLFTVMGLLQILNNSCKKTEEEPFVEKIPVVSTSSLSNIKQSTAQSGGNVADDGGVTLTARGICWSKQQSPTLANSKTTDGTATGSFTSSITGLTPNTVYYVRAYATNAKGTGYGNEVMFTTLQDTLTVTDIDGNIYHTVTIGSQVWLVENLKVTQYNDGTPIPLVTVGTDWGNLTTPAYCWYNNSYATYGSVYGALYNWYAVNTGKLCPPGWHVPTSAEWTVLTNYLGGESEAGGKLKETGTTHWASPNTGATNETGFTALPGGSRYNTGSFQLNITFNGLWWSSTGYSTSNATYLVMSYNNTIG
jgi:uncharacterized protein (TIGR02145 family)